MVFDVSTSSNPSPCVLPCEEAITKPNSIRYLVRVAQHHNALKRYAAFAEGFVFPSGFTFRSQQLDVPAANTRPGSDSSSHTIACHIDRMSVHFSSIRCSVHRPRHSTSLMVVPTRYSYIDCGACKVLDNGNELGYGRARKDEV